jgi:hypothetical protein
MSFDRSKDDNRSHTKRHGLLKIRQFTSTLLYGIQRINRIKLVFLLAITGLADELSSVRCTSHPWKININCIAKLPPGYSGHGTYFRVAYYKIPRHPGKGKIHIPVTHILDHIREAGNLSPHGCPLSELPAGDHHQRTGGF